MIDKIIRPWVDAMTDEKGDLHLQAGIDDPEGISTKISYTIMSLKQIEIHKWIKNQGWASPEERSELLEALKKIVLKSPEYGPLWRGSDEMKLARSAIAKSRGETE